MAMLIKSKHCSRIVLDPDNLFWAVLPKSKKAHPPVPPGVSSLYKKIKKGLDKEMADFRFSSQLTAVYIDPTDRCNANCPYCYVPQGIRRNGRSMAGDELTSILRKIAGYFGGRERKNCVIVLHASEPLLVKDVVFKAIERFG